MKTKIWLILCFLGFAHLFFLLNTKFTAWPEMLAWPYFILKGWLPYRDIAIAHTPLLILDLTLFYKIFGVGVWQIKAYSWLLILATDLIVFFVARKLTNLKTAVISLMFFIPLQIFYEGNGIWFDYAVAPLALLSFYFIKEKRYLLAGLLWGLAFFTKQTAFWFLPGVVFLFWGKDFIYKFKEFLCGTLTVYAVVFVSFFLMGILPDFLFWAFRYGIGTLPMASGQIALPSIKQALIALAPFLILLIGIRKDWKIYLPVILWAILGIAGACPRWELFHFQPALPFLAIGAALIFTGLKKTQKLFLGVFTAYFLFLFLLLGRQVVKDWHQSDRFLEPSVIKTAQTIKSLTDKGDRIFVLNTWDNLYALSDRLPSVKPWIPQLSWYLSINGAEKSLSSDLVTNPPKLVVMQPYTTTGLSAFKPKGITDIIFKFYETEKIIDNSFYILKPYR